MYLHQVILMPFFDKITGLVTTRPQRLSLWAKVQGPTVIFAIRISILRGRFYDLEVDMDSWEFRLLTTSGEIGGQLLHLIARQKSITNSSVRKMGEKNSDYRKKLSY